MNWNEYREELLADMSAFEKLSPNVMAGLQQVSEAGKTPRLDPKTRSLIALALAVTTRCEGCISVHAKNAADRGATPEEVAEALGVAISLNAGAALVYSTRVLDAYSAAQRNE